MVVSHSSWLVWQKRDILIKYHLPHVLTVIVKFDIVLRKMNYYKFNLYQLQYAYDFILISLEVATKLVVVSELSALLFIEKVRLRT